MLYFVRHGSTDWNENVDKFGNKSPKCQGRADLPLNNVGIKQAKKTALYLDGIHFDKVFCSPLLRARQTCEIIYKGDTEVVFDDRLLERDFGEFEGMTRNEFDFVGFCENRDLKFKTAETIEHIEKRVFSFLEDILKNPNDNVLIVSHGGVGTVVKRFFEKRLKDTSVLEKEFKHGQPYLIDTSPDNFIINS